MSGISSGIGLLSGLPTQSIINQLIAIESRPLTLLQRRVQGVQIQRTAFADITARLLGLKSVTKRLDELSFFRASRATSSNESVLSAVAAEGASIGAFQFQVKSLVTNNQLIGRGFVDADRQPVGVGTLTLEIGNGRLDRSTTLDMLNGGDGVRRGTFEIADSSGATATIDISTALSVADVIDEINGATAVNVLARVEGDHLVVQDRAGGTRTLAISDLDGRHAAADLGIAQRDLDADGAITGNRIIFLVGESQISTLNDGNGVNIGKTNNDLLLTFGDRTFTIGLRGLLTSNTQLEVLNNGNGVRQGTFRITNRAGQSADIVIDETVRSVSDVLDRINGAGISVAATIGAVSGQFVITDGSTPPAGQDEVNFKIEDVSGQAATDLGILVDVDDDTITGNEIHRISTLGDIIRAINFSVDQNGTLNDVVVARISQTGRGIELENVSGGGEFTIEASPNAVESTAAENLGLIGTSVDGRFVSRDLLAGLNSVLVDSLRGGQGVELGQVLLRAADGSQAEVDLSGAASVQDVIDLVNAVTDTSKVSARLNDVGNGIIFVDESGATGTMRLKDISGGFIRDLFSLDGAVGALVESDAGTLNTGNTQLQYISRATRLENLNQGRGVATGSFLLTAANGQRLTINLTDRQETVSDVVNLINGLANAFSLDVEARINSQGDGIEIIDRSEGTGELSITAQNGSTTAKDLNIAGTGVAFTDEGGIARQRIDGSFEFRIEVDADDTLTDVQEKINALGIDLNANIVNDGSAIRPFHLVIGSEISGTRGQLHIDPGTTGLSFDTLVRAQDAVVFFGGAGAENPIVLTSSTNSLSNVLDDVTINLVGTSDEPVELSITQDVDAIVTDLQTFVSSYNAVLERMDQLTRFDADTNTRGDLFGDSTINIIRNRLRSVINARVSDAPDGLDRLAFVGIRSGSGGRLTFDDNKFRELFSANPQAVETLFTAEDDGIGTRLDAMLEDLTNSFDGVLARKDSGLEKREDLFNDRIESLQELLDRKRDRLERQFQGLESSLAVLQGAQNALASLAILSF